MTSPTEFDPFAGIIQRALTARRTSKLDHEQHPDHAAPRYVVRMCEALTQAIHDAGNPSITLADVVRLESTCTGADYAHKFAMRCHRLALSAAA